VTLDVYATKTAADTWQIDVYDNAASDQQRFPYSSGPLDSQQFTFDTSRHGSRQASAGFGRARRPFRPADEPSPLPLRRTPRRSTSTMSQLTQVSASYSFVAKVDGNAVSQIDSIRHRQGGRRFGDLSRTGPSKISTRSSWRLCRVPTTSIRASATHMRSAWRPETCKSATPARAGLGTIEIRGA